MKFIDYLFDVENKNSVEIWFFIGLVSFFPLLGLIPLVIIIALAKINKNSLRPAVLGVAITHICFVIISLVVFLASGFNMFNPSEIKIFLPYLCSVLIASIIIVIYEKERKTLKYINKIYSLISVDHITDINRIGEVLGINKSKTTNYINQMISDGKFNGKINENGNELILFNSVWASQVCICNNCGASITVNFGDTLTCPYCSSALSIKNITNKNK